MIKLLAIPFVRIVKRLVIFSEKDMYSLEVPTDIKLDEYSQLFLGAEEFKEKLPAYVKLRVHTLKEVKKDGR